jgi:hypothetical protein
MSTTPPTEPNRPGPDGDPAFPNALVTDLRRLYARPITLSAADDAAVLAAARAALDAALAAKARRRRVVTMLAAAGSVAAAAALALGVWLSYLPARPPRDVALSKQGAASDPLSAGTEAVRAIEGGEARARREARALGEGSAAPKEASIAAAQVARSDAADNAGTPPAGVPGAPASGAGPMYGTGGSGAVGGAGGGGGGGPVTGGLAAAVLGDVNRDGSVNIVDALLLAHELLDQKLPTAPAEVALRDLDKSGTITPADVEAIATIAVRLSPAASTPGLPLVRALLAELARRPVTLGSALPASTTLCGEHP